MRNQSVTLLLFNVLQNIQLLKKHEETVNIFSLCYAAAMQTYSQ